MGVEHKITDREQIQFLRSYINQLHDHIEWQDAHFMNLLKQAEPIHFEECQLSGFAKAAGEMKQHTKKLFVKSMTSIKQSIEKYKTKQTNKGQAISLSYINSWNNKIRSIMAHNNAQETEIQILKMENRKLKETIMGVDTSKGTQVGQMLQESQYEMFLKITTPWRN